jgi:predicted aspartyl protease
VCDTGARVSLLNKSTADRLGLTVSNEQLLLSTYTGEKVQGVRSVTCEGAV